MAGRPDRRPDHHASPRPVPPMWTGTSPRSPTRVPGRSWTAGRRGDGPVRPRGRRSETPRGGGEAARRRPRSTRSPSTAPSRIDAEVDLADALDLEDALRAGAKQQADLGSPSPWTYAAPSPSATWPAASSPSGSTPTSPAGRGPGRAHLHDAPDRTETGRPVWQHPVPDQRGADPRVVRQPERQGHRETGGRPGRAHPRRGLRSTRPAQGPERSGRRPLRVPALHQTSQHGATPTTSSRTPTADRPARTTPRRCADATTAPRPTVAWDYSVLDRGTYLWTTPNGTQADPRPPRHPANPDHPAPHPGQERRWPGPLA